MITDSLQQPILSTWNLDRLLAILEGVHISLGMEALTKNRRLEGSQQDSLFLTWSGGLDSTVSLVLLKKYFPSFDIHAFTIGESEDHPDLVATKAMRDQVGLRHHHIIIPTQEEKEEMRTRLIDKNRNVGNGDIAVALVYKHMAEMGARTVLAHDGIDELLGGYWDHRKSSDPQEKLSAFELYWKQLRENHLEPLNRTAVMFRINPEFPYLDQRVVEYITLLPLDARTDRSESKKPLRAIARMIGVPELAITRPKIGFCDALKPLCLESH